jgi:hypothetical protein
MKDAGMAGSHELKVGFCYHLERIELSDNGVPLVVLSGLRLRYPAAWFRPVASTALTKLLKGETND